MATPLMLPLPGSEVQIITGVDETLRKLKQLGVAGAQGAELGVLKATKNLLEKTLIVTPEDTGELKQSSGTVFTGRGFDKVGMVYFDAPYAIYVHEDLTKFHKHPTKAKFLQQTAWETRGETSAIIETEIRRAQRRAL